MIHTIKTNKKKTDVFQEAPANEKDWGQKHITVQYITNRGNVGKGTAVLLYIYTY